jgi:hypothetical protein
MLRNLIFRDLSSGPWTLADCSCDIDADRRDMSPVSRTILLADSLGCRVKRAAICAQVPMMCAELHW